MAATDTAAAALIEEVQAEVAAEQTTEPGEEPAAEVTEAPTLEPELPADVRAILEETPDEEGDEDEDELEPAAAVEFEEPVDTWEDEDTGLRKQLNKLTRERDFLKKQTLKAGRKEWQAEIEQYFPLAAAKDIASEAGSRRDALKQAAYQQSLAKNGAKAVADHYEQNIDRIVAERIDAERAALHAQWGKPIGGPGSVPVAAGERAAADEDINQARTLHERMLKKIQQGKLGPELYVTDLTEGAE